jgi:hypothetical protein
MPRRPQSARDRAVGGLEELNSAALSACVAMQAIVDRRRCGRRRDRRARRGCSSTSHA